MKKTRSKGKTKSKISNKGIARKKSPALISSNEVATIRAEQIVLDKKPVYQKKDDNAIHKPDSNSISIEKTCSRPYNKNNSLLTLAGIIIFILSISITLIIFFQKAPTYSYKDFKWSPRSSSISYIRTENVSDSLKNNNAQIQHEIWVISLDSRSKRKIATINGEKDSIFLLGWNNEESKIYIKKKLDKTTELYIVSLESMDISKYNLSLPGLEKIIFDKGFIFTQQYDPIEKNKRIGYLSLEEGKYINVADFILRNNETLELTNIKISNHLDKCAFSMYFAIDDNETGRNHVWLYNLKDQKLHKPQIQSFGREISFEWSPYDDFIGACIGEKFSDDRISYTINFFDIRNEEKGKKLSASDINTSFNIFWNQQNKLFIIMKDSIYLMMMNEKTPVAKALLNWDMIGYNPNEYNISPDGKQIVFNSIRHNRLEFNDVLVMDIDGTNIKNLIDPEGRRFLERSPVFKYFLSSKKVIENLSVYRRIHKS